MISQSPWHHLHYSHLWPDFSRSQTDSVLIFRYPNLAGLSRQYEKTSAMATNSVTFARLITLTGRYEHITPAFIALHWLPIKERCEFKILLLTYKCFNGLAPAYLDELLHKRPERGSRRDNHNLLIVPKVNKVTFGVIAFKRAAPDLWNSIPSSLLKSKTVDILKFGLKTLLFKRGFNL